MDYETEVALRTYKEEDIETERRVFYTLTQDVKNVDAVSHRNAKLLGLLTAHLTKQGLINEADLDAMLFEAIR